MNTEILHELIRRYEGALGWIYGTEHDELFKWRAMKTWQREWFRPADSFSSFGERFSAAKRGFGWFTDNSRMHPSSGVIKLWEKEPDTVEHLFNEVLFADANGDVSAVQDHMDAFLDGYEALRQKHFPGNWSYKQDRHSASVYLAVYDPGFNYVYKSSEALTMARYIDFRSVIGTGSYFKLANYYLLCETIIEALREHERLLEQHFGKMDDRCYRDESLHLLAFDLMYCSRTYNFYKGLPVPEIYRPKRKVSGPAGSSTDPDEAEIRRQAEIAALEAEIAELESGSYDCEDISLLGVQVTSPQFGTGTVVGQAVNKIDVQFPGAQKSFILDKRYPSRPRFEDDDAVVEAFTAYAERVKRIKDLKTKLERLLK